MGRKVAPINKRLSFNQEEVLILAAEGYDIRGTAQYMDIAVGTVKGHRSVIIRKMGVTTLAQAVGKYLMELGYHNTNGAVTRMKAWAAEHPEANTQGLTEHEWEAMAYAALGIETIMRRISYENAMA